MSDATAPDLSLTDIKFLRAIRDINAAPDEYDGTGEGQAPASTTAIRNATGLSKGKLHHRLDPDSKLADPDGHALIKVYEPELDNGRLTPKSAELTDRGGQVLEDSLVKHGFEERETAETHQVERVAEVEARTENLGERVAELESQVNSLEETISDLTETVNRFQESETGAFDAGRVDEFEALVDALPRHETAIRLLFGMPSSELADTEELDQKAVLAEVRDRLGAGTESSGTDGRDSADSTSATQPDLMESAQGGTADEP